MRGLNSARGAVGLIASLLLPGMTAVAQIDLTGNWVALYHEDAPERLPGPALGDYLELPINEAARLRADSYDPNRISAVVEYQCRPHGMPRSAKATLTEHWVRHGNYLTVVTYIDDPAFLTEPLVRNSNWVLEPSARMVPNSCTPAHEVPVPEGTVPHYLPGENPFSREFSEFFGVPFEATRGGAHTLYPEFRMTMGEVPTPPQCTRYCVCTGLGNCGG